MTKTLVLYHVSTFHLLVIVIVLISLVVPSNDIALASAVCINLKTQNISLRMCIHYMHVI